MKKQLHNSLFSQFIWLFTMLLTTGITHAQISTYTFTNTLGTYTPITGGNVVNATTADDDNNYALQPIGFTFNYGAGSYTSVGISANGYVRLGAVTAIYYGTSLSSQLQTLSAFNGDLQGKGMTTSEIRIQTLGTAPNRVCVIQWRDWGRYQNTTYPNDTLNFQIRLREDSAAVEFVYGSCALASTGTGPWGVQVGINGDVLTDFNLRTGASFITNTAGTANTQQINASNTAVPDLGRRYRWGPAPMVLDSVYTFQNSSSVVRGATNQVILNIKVYTSGVLSPFNVSNLNFNTNGTTLPSDIVNAKVYFTGTNNTFNATSQYGATITAPSGTMTFTGSQTLVPGVNNFWITYDVSNTATVNNFLDAEFNNITINSTPVTPLNTTAPTGARQIRGQLSGAYTIGATGNYTSITQAFGDLSSLGMIGPVTFELLDPIYNSTTGEVFPITLSNVSGNNANNTITLRSANLNNAVILGNNATSLFIIEGVKYFTIDGRWDPTDTARHITIENTSTSATTANVLIFRNEASANTVRNTIIRYAANNTSTIPTNSAIFVGGTTNLIGVGNDSLNFLYNIFAPSGGLYYGTAITFSGQSLTQQNDWARIDSNWFYGHRIFGVNIASTSQGNGRQFLIRGNSFYDTVAVAPNPNAWTGLHSDIYMNAGNAASWGHQITGNYMGGQGPFASGPRQFVNPGTASIYNIWYNASNITPGARVANNWITNQIYNQGGVASFYYPYHYYISTGYVDVLGNVIGHPTDTHSVRYDNNSGTCMYGLYMFHTAPTNIKFNRVQNVTVNSTGSNGYVGIYHAATTIGEAFVDSNIVNRFFTRASSTSTSTCAAFGGLFISNNSPTHYIRGNIVGGPTAEDSVSVFSSNPLNPSVSTPVTSSMYGIWNNAGISQVSNNFIGNLYTNSSSTGTSTSASLVGIHQVSGTGGSLVINNTVSDLINRFPAAGTITYGITSLSATTTLTSNTIRNITTNSTSTGTSTATSLAGIYISSSQIQTTTNNTIRNLVSLTSAGTQVVGIQSQVNALNLVRGNSISQLISNTTNSNTANSSGIVGINITAFQLNQTVDSNTIVDLISTNSGASVNPSITGIAFSGSATVVGNNSAVTRNRIWGLTHTYPSAPTPVGAIQHGINISNGTVTVANNLVRLGRDSAGVVQLRPGQYRGIISAASSNQVRIYHNNVLVEFAPDYGTGGFPNPSTGCLEFTGNASAPGFIDVRNNIFANNSINGGTSTLNHYNEMYSTSSALLTTNTNLLSNVASANSFVVRWNATNYTGLNDFRTFTRQAGASGMGNPLFIAPNASSALINLQVGATNPAESMGDTTVSAIVTNDVNGLNRSAFGPADIGASAGNFTLSSDSIAPLIYYTPLTNTSSPAARTFTATLFDGTGFPTDTAFGPRVYYKKSTQLTWVNTPGTFVSGTVRNRVYSFTIDHALLGGLLPGDIVQYYVIAADTGVGNINSNPAYALAVNTGSVTTHPAVANSYLFNDPVPTVVYLGTGAGSPAFTTLTGTGGLFETINNSALQGNTLVLVQSNVTEPATVELNKWLEVGTGGYQLTIRPASNTQVIISGGNASANGMIRFNNTDNVRILGWDTLGTPNDTNLIIRSSSTSTPAIGFVNGGSTDTLQSVIFESRVSGTTSGVIFIPATTAASTRGVSNVLVNNCWIRQDLTGTTFAANGIYAAGSSPRFNTDITVNNSKFANFTQSGVFFTSGTGSNIRITNNHFYYNYGTNTSTTLNVINLTPATTSNSNGNLVTGNFIGGRDLFAAGLPWTNNASLTFNGITLNTGTASGTTVNNNVIQNFNFTSTTNTLTLTGIFAQGTSSVYVINNNRIGSNNMAESILSNNNGRFIGINTTTTGNVTLNNDSIINIRVVNTGTTAALAGIWSQSGSTNVVNINNNFISNLFTSSSNTGTANTTCALIGIATTHSTLNLTINNNTIRSLVAPTAAATLIRGIWVSSGTPTLNGNTVFGIQTNSTAAGTLTTNAVTGIASTTTLNGFISISNNTVDSVWRTGTLVSSQMIGIQYNSGGTQTANVNGNIIRNLNLVSSSTGTTTSSALVGLYVNAAATVNSNYNDNRISVLNHLSNAGSNIVGMYMATSVSVNGNSSTAARNLVHSLRSAATTATTTQTGILNQQGFVTYANNMIRMGIDSSGTAYVNPSTIRGIWHVNSTQSFYYHNSVLIGGQPSTGTANTFAFDRTISITSGQQIDLRNNIFANIASNTGTASGFHFGTSHQDSLRTVSNYNIIYTPGTGGIAARIGQFNTNYTLLSGSNTSYKAIVGLDMISSSADPGFGAAALAAAPAVDLSLSASTPAERGGDPSVTVVTNDYFGNSRSSLSPTDVGAHAGNFNMIDAFPPAISYTPLTNAGSLTGTRALTNVTITDNNGIVMSGANRPRIYYTRNGITWFSGGALTVTGTSTNAVASFAIDYLSFSPALTLSDTVRYFVVAQDAAGNLQSFPALASGTNVNTLVEYPLNPFRYSFLPVIAANTVIPVGAGQTYTSLTNAGGLFEFINNRTLGGNVFVEITSDITNESGLVALNKFAEDGPGAGTFTLTIRPDATATTPRTIQGNFLNTSSVNGLITLIGADRVKFTGIRNGGSPTERLLRFRNVATTGAYAANTGNGVFVVSSASGVVMRNLIVESGNSNTAGGSIEFRVGNNSQFLTTPCSFDTVTNCILTNNTLATLPDGIPGNAGIYSLGQPNVYNNNIVITDNQISNFVVAGVGVVGNNGDGFVITGNSFFYNLGFVPNITGTFQAIVFLGGSFSSGNNMSNNFIGGSAPNCGGTAWTNPNNIGFYGIRASVGNGANSLFNNNTIQNLAFTNNAATQLFNGIRVEAGNAVINNNQIGHPTNTNSILWSTGGTFYGIYYFGVNNVTYQNNAVQGINMNVANVTPQFIGLYHQSGSIVGNISGNTIGHNTTPNSIFIASNTTHYGMLLSVLAAYSSNYTVSNNLIANMTATATGTGGIMYGMLVQSNSFPIITNNTVHNLRSASISTSTAGIAAGIVVSASSATNTVLNNTVYSIRGTNTGATPSSVYGIYMSAGQDNVFRNNRIYDITNASTSTSLNPAPTVAGLAIAGASNQIFVQNNQISLGTGLTQDIQIKGIWLFTSTVAVTLNAHNNTIVIDGAATSGIQNTYGYLRGNNTGTEINTYNNFRNNIIVNRRTGGTGFHYALSNQASSPSNTTWLNTSSAYNLLSTANVNAVGEWGLSNNNLANWRLNSTGDVLSYYVQAGTGAGQLNINNLFTNIGAGNLGLNTSNAEVWYAYGKGITGSEINNLNTDFNGNTRSTTQGIATTIGSVHMTSAPSMLPIAATASAAPAASTTTSYTFAGRPVASINWGASAPTSATVYDFTGVNPPSSPAGNFNNRYVRADISGGTAPYNYGLVYNFNAANLGTTINGNNIRLATSNVAVPTSWTTQFTTSSNASTGIASVSGLSSTGSFITFTGTELAAPPTINVVSPSAASIGAAVTIRGSLFTGSTALNFNGVAQTVYTIVDDTTITTTVPAGATTGPIQITNAFGTGTSAFNFTVIPAPTIASFSPSSGTFNSAVTITGSGFTWATGVRFNGQNASFTVVNNTTINTNVPAGSTTGNIRVTNGTDSIESSSAYTVFQAPTVTSFTPSTGPAGTTVTITGTDFNAITNVRFNGVNASFTVNSTTSITATVPSGASTGAITVVNGSGTGTSGTNFTVTLPPSISGFSPSSGGVGSSVVITGTNFTGATAVSFNGTAAASFTVNSSSQITAVVGTGTTTGNIIVVTPSGADTSVTPYTVIADLIVSTSATVSGTYNSITVTGTGVATLGGTLTALGNTVIQTGGTINFGTEVLSGIGNFTAQSGSRITVGSPQGIDAVGISGNIQVNGTRTINAGARVEYAAITGNQNTGNLISNVDTIIVNLGSGDLILNNSITVNRHLEFVSGSVRLGANNLTIGSTGSIVNATSTNYVKTNGIGTLRRTVQNNSTNVVYPVGSLSSFTPAQVQLNGTSTTDIISVRVFNGVLANATSGLPLATSMVDRTWAISETVAGGSNATITLTWNSLEEVGGFNRTQSAVSRYNTGNNQWTYVGTAFGAATGTDPYSRSISGVTSLTFFTLGDSFATSLPVNLVSFAGKGLNEDVLLTWTTASEQNNRGFSVERSTDGENFTEINFVNGKEYSVVRVNYELLDEGAFAATQANTLYYRLRQVDFDGTETLSSVVSVNRDTKAVTSVKAYPNPFNTGLQVEVVSVQDAEYTLTVTDIQGRVISNRDVMIEKGMNRISLEELDNLKGGIYFVRLNGAESTTLKVVKTN